jgi:hypothetical protein
VSANPPAEEAARANITPDHLNGAMPGLVHYAPFRCPADRGRSSVPGTKAMTGKLGRIEPGTFRRFFDIGATSIPDNAPAEPATVFAC